MRCIRCHQQIQRGQDVLLVERVVDAAPFRTLGRDKEGRLRYVHLFCPTATT